MSKPTRLSNEALRALYGANALISRKGAFTLVHLDSPSPSTIRKRRREFDPTKVFCANCPLCRLMKDNRIVVFDDSVFDREEKANQ